MKANKPKIDSTVHLEKTLTLAGLTLILVGVIANLFSAYVNRGFIHAPIDFLYYFRYIILLGGGFAVGYLLTNKAARSTHYNRLFIGVGYAVLAMTIYWLFDVARVGLQGPVGHLTYPWANIVFMCEPVLAVVTVLILATFSQRKSVRSGLNTLTKVALVIAFIVYQVYTLASGAYYILIGTAQPDPLWLTIGGYFITPIVIAIVSYALLNGVKRRFDRFFYAALIGAFYSCLTSVLWEFRTDPSNTATNVFGSVVAILTLLFVGVLLWRARKAVK